VAGWVAFAGEPLGTAFHRLLVFFMLALLAYVGQSDHVVKPRFRFGGKAGIERNVEHASKLVLERHRD